MDLISPLPMSNGHNAIQVFADTGSKGIHIEPCHMEIGAESVAKLLWNRVIHYHGLLKKIISDRDKRYSGHFMTELYKLLEIQANVSTAYQLQTDRQTERANQEIEQYPQIFIAQHQSDWSDWMALAEFFYNNKVNSSTKETLFFLMYGKHPWKGIEPRYISKSEDVTNFAKQIKLIRDNTEAVLLKAKAQMTLRYNLRRREAPKFKLVTKFMLKPPTLNKIDLPRSFQISGLDSMSLSF
jgi:hypothetical protein